MLTIYSKNHCPFCDMAKNYLKSKNIPFREIDIEQDQEAREFIQSQGHRTVPQIYMHNKVFVEGGWSGLSKMTAQDIFNEIELRDSLTNDIGNGGELRNNIKFLSGFIELKPHNILEIGCYRGGSTSIWLENFLTESGTIVCIDPFNVSDNDPFGMSDLKSDFDLEQEFWDTINRSKKSTQNIDLRRGRSYRELAKLIFENQRFDLIYIDGNHGGASVISDACMAFGMLNKAGIMLFDDFFWHDSIGVNGQALNALDWPKMAIDAFTTLYHNNIEILFINYQYAIRKW